MKELEDGSLIMSEAEVMEVRKLDDEKKELFQISTQFAKQMEDKLNLEKKRNALLRKENIRIYDEKAMLNREIDSKDRLITALQELVTELEKSCDYYAGLVNDILPSNRNESAANVSVICLDPLIGDGKEHV